jgi:SNF2 family DNA or RNA helicase
MLKFHLASKNTLDLSEVGVGKSAGLALSIQNAIRTGQTESALIVAPNSILDNWARELEMWTDLSCVILRGEKKKRIALLGEPKDVYIINLEGLRVIFDELMAKRFNMIVTDEIHHAKSPKAQVTKALLKLGEKAEIRKGATGTLITNSLEDVWSISRFISPTIFPGNVWAFRSRYMTNLNAGQPWRNWPDFQPKPGAAEEVRRRLAPYVIRFEKKAVLRFLPPVLFEKRMVTLGDEQRRVYKELKREFMADLDDGTIVLAAQILPRITKLIEVTSGFLYTETEPGKRSTYRFRQNAKLDELKNLLAEIGNKRIVIWASFREDIAIVRDSLSALDVRAITGDTPAAERQSIVDLFNSNQFQYLLCNPQAAGEGLSIYAEYAIYFSRGWKLGERLQSLGRHDRPGSEIFDNVTIFDLVAENTVDVEVFAALEGKEELLKSINPKRAREMLR